MPLIVNLRRLEGKTLRLKGELDPGELDLDIRDEAIQANQPLEYDLRVEELEPDILVQGRLRLVLDCECVRCLKKIQIPLKLDPWACHLPLQGDEAAPIVNDCLDLTPYVREDILLEFPRHPLCDEECPGLPKKPIGRKKNPGSAGQNEGGVTVWSVLNKLKL